MASQTRDTSLSAYTQETSWGVLRNHGGFDVGDTIVHDIPLHVKLCLVRNLSSLSSLQLSLACCEHSFGSVHLSQWDGSHIVSVRRGVKEMWKIPLLEIVGIQAKCFGKRSQSHGEQRHGVDEANVPTLVGELQKLATRTRGLKLLFALDQMLHHTVRVIALEILGKSCDVACVLLCEFFKPSQKLFNVILATKDLRGGILFRHTHHQIRHMQARISCMASVSQKTSSGGW